MEEQLKLHIRDINPHIVCGLCAGYFVEATTITECLHTFCKSCIVKCLQSSKNCPQCGLKIHETQPLMNLKPDRVMQDIVFKLVPGLYEGEEKRMQEFYKSRGILQEKKEEDFPSAPPLTSVYDHPEAHYYRHDEQICMCLEQYRYPENEGGSLWRLPKKFVRCSVRTCIQHVQLLLHKKLALPRSKQVAIICNDTVLNPEMTLKQVWISHWYGQQSPLLLFYKIYSEDASNSSSTFLTKTGNVTSHHPVLMT